MNKTAIEWCTHSWNPVTGCNHGCSYCYARKIANRFKGSKAWPQGFEPMFHPTRLRDPFLLDKPAIIFCGSMSDVFGDWWDKPVIVNILDTIRGAPKHRFVILTKNPKRIAGTLEDYSADSLGHCYFGTSVTGTDTTEEIDRLRQLRGVSDKGFKTVISFEPLLHDPMALFRAIGGVPWVSWVIVGGQTNPTVFPPYLSKCAVRDWVVADCGIPLFIKDNAVATKCTREKNGNNGVKWFPDDLESIAETWKK